MKQALHITQTNTTNNDRLHNSSVLSQSLTLGPFTQQSWWITVKLTEWFSR